jgi:hypothetical protein
MSGALVAGCGGDDESSSAPASDEEQITTAIKTAYKAFADLDAEGLCAQFTADQRADFEDYYGPCEKATLEGQLAELSDAQKSKLTDPEIGPLKIEGKEAYPDVNGEGLEIAKEGDTWKLDDFDLPE